MFTSLQGTIENAFQGISSGIISFVPSLFWALVIFVVSWVIGAFAGKIVATLFKTAKVDQGLEQAGIRGVLDRAGVNLNSGAFVGGLVQWFVIILGIVVAFDVVGLSQVNVFLQQVVLLYIPRVLVAVLILIVAVVLGDTVSKIVVGSSKAAHVRNANFLGTLTKWSIWIFAFLTALVQLGIAVSFIETLFTGVIVALSLAFGLAFGLGGQQAAAHYIEKIKKDISE